MFYFEGQIRRIERKTFLHEKSQCRNTFMKRQPSVLDLTYRSTRDNFIPVPRFATLDENTHESSVFYAAHFSPLSHDNNLRSHVPPLTFTTPLPGPNRKDPTHGTLCRLHRSPHKPKQRRPFISMRETLCNALALQYSHSFPLLFSSCIIIFAFSFTQACTQGAVM